MTIPRGTAGGSMGARDLRLIAFHWEGLEAAWNGRSGTALPEAMERLLSRGVTFAVLAENGAGAVGSALGARLSPEARRRLYVLGAGGGELYAYGESGGLERLWTTLAEGVAERPTPQGMELVVRDLAPLRGIEPHEILICDGATDAPALERVLGEQLARPSLEPAPEPAPAAADAAAAAGEGPGWTIAASGYDPAAEPSLETLFSLTNGYLGVRGSADEGGPQSRPGAYIAGLFGGAALGQEDMVVVPDWVTTEISIDGEPLRPETATVEEHERSLDLATFRLVRVLSLRDGRGRLVSLRTERLLSRAEPQLAAVRLELSVDAPEPTPVRVRAGAFLPRPGSLPTVDLVAAGEDDGIDLLETRTPGARVAVDVAQALAADLDGRPLEAPHGSGDDWSGRVVDCTIARGQVLRIERFVGVATEREQPLPGPVAAQTARLAAARGWNAVAAEHAAAWERAWERADVEIEGDPMAQLGARFAVAQLLAVAPAPQTDASIGAKGLSGPGYKGHVFWDTDVYLLPFYATADPETARRILEYRVRTLPAARAHAAEAGLEGAWFAWESAATGRDVTPTMLVGPGGRTLVVRTGQQEIHVVPDIAWATDLYACAADDAAFLASGGGALLVEAARFCASRAIETPRGYEIRHVIGPDELHEDVDNNAYTNLLAAWTLRRAAALVEQGGADPALAVGPEEPGRWRAVADGMLVLRSPDGLIEQHEGFLELPLRSEPRQPGSAAWEQDRMSWRDVKQADVVMLMSLLEPVFDEATRRAHFELYEPLALHLSSLSEAVHSLVARRAGLPERADEYLARAIRIDLEDSRGNRADGMHMATQGGIWQAVVMGCGGLRAGEEALRLDPRLPDGWRRLRFRACYHGADLRVTTTLEELLVEAAGEQGAAVEVSGARHHVGPAEPLRLVRCDAGWRQVPQR